MKIDINTDAVVVFTNKLEKLSKSALPLVIKNTLNNAAFDMKTKTIEQSTDEKFTKRKKTFFKATSKVFMANGNDIKTMKSTIGFVGDSQAVSDLEEQETGGIIKGRSFVPLNTARVSKAKTKSIRANERLALLKSKKIIHQQDSEGKNSGAKFAKAVAVAGVGGLVLGNLPERNILWRVNSLKRDKDGKYKLTGLYTQETNRTVTVDKTNFMEIAANVTREKIEAFFIKQATEKIEKSLK